MSHSSEKTPVAVVTGALGGLGRAIVTGLLEAGVRVAATDVRAPESQRDERCLGLAMDVRRLASVEKAKDAILERFGRVDVLVNNAGVFHRLPAIPIDETRLEEILDVNLKGTLRCTAVFGAVMAQARQGRIINIASVAGERGAALASAYAASKGGVIAATSSLARELAGHGIRVNAIAPGLIHTPMYEREKEAADRFVVPQIPARRPGRPEEVAELVVFLATSKGDYVNGSVLRIDGGVSGG